MDQEVQAERMTREDVEMVGGGRARDERVAIAGKRLHFVGIGGCGMSGLARICKRLGAVCSGSDMNESVVVKGLRGDGILVAPPEVGFMDFLDADSELDKLVISAAIKAEHPEVLAAKAKGIEVVKYAKLLGELMIGRQGVAIAGTHGKSSTTSMLAHVLISAGLDPSFIVGANCEQIGGGSRVGCDVVGKDFLLAEACEFDRSFHQFHPTHGVILNVEADHLDVYKNLDEIVEAFKVFAEQLPGAGGGGSLLINHEMGCRLEIAGGLDCEVQTLGYSSEADWQVRLNKGKVYLDRGGEKVCSWKAALPGMHMAYNAAAAGITANRLGANWEAICEALESFTGLDRRMQVIGEKILGDEDLTDDKRGRKRGGKVVVLDDYGHHPTEVDATLRALRNHYDPKRLICVFQPHQHSRTRFLMEQFATSFGEADIVIVPHIYFVRDSEAERHAVTSADLVDRLRQKGVQAMHLYPFEAIVEQLSLITGDGDLVVTMGAGDVWKVARWYMDT
ncbi:UDP-N-acetylmuramate--L-alanine ligase MurC [Poriferisphaera corsica]|uniref:UDP-N-acetylmuramate--L-alanine ligase n=1 Tax=Poriferisphaera corsica TaxID=2528020 RepID=A0A517YYM4_9BACT|nr:UDP-N-acetylmuramate--L-alanine ligase [Poriferisphaera corsica]QDU35323.1 UDP-N-acetylmuramate--L-alanine ligase MurC [Poriferisphaera corsica]